MTVTDPTEVPQDSSGSADDHKRYSQAELEAAVAEEDDMTLRSAVVSLNKSVEVLVNAIKNGFVKREELTEYITRRNWQRRTIFTVVIAVCAFMGSFVSAIGFTGYCFLQGEVRPVCKFIPGYTDTVNRLVMNRENNYDNIIRTTQLELELQKLRNDLYALEQQADALAENP